jgi:hypothetical protein
VIEVDVLTGRHRPISSMGLVEPLLRNRELFRDAGINIRRVYSRPDRTRGSDVLILDSKVLKAQWGSNPDIALNTISDLRSRTNKLCFFDSADSTGSVQTQVIPFVDLYLKAQVLRDKTQYEKTLYGERVYTDYFFRHLGIRDSDEIFSHALSSSEIKKIRPAWNVGLAGGYGKRINPLWRVFPLLICGIHMDRRNFYNAPGGSREIDLLTRMTINQTRETVAYQRNHALNILASYAPKVGAVSKSTYLAEMRRSKVVLAPFAWGEMNMRDFECFALGGLLAKPSMSHMTTFPNYYIENQTYIPVDWALTDLAQKIDFILGNYNDFLEVAEFGHNVFRYYADDINGRQEFVEYAASILINEDSSKEQ